MQELEEHGSVALRTWELTLENFVTGDSRGRQATGGSVKCGAPGESDVRAMMYVQFHWMH